VAKRKIALLVHQDLCNYRNVLINASCICVVNLNIVLISKASRYTMSTLLHIFVL
jgi:hypothetical protein